MNYQLWNKDFLLGVKKIEDNSIDLIVTDPPYCLGKDYGNDSDQKSSTEFLRWTEEWLQLAIPKLKETGSLYIFTSWQYSPEIFSFLKKELIMINEIISKVPSMGGIPKQIKQMAKSKTADSGECYSFYEF